MNTSRTTADEPGECRKLMQVLTATPLLLYLIFGLVYCYFGYKFVKTMLIAFGCFGGLAVGLWLGYLLLGQQPLGVLVIGALAAGGGGLVCALLFRFALFCAGFAAGAVVAPAVLPLVGMTVETPAGLIGVAISGVVMGLIALLLEREVMVLGSAAIGAVVTVVCVHLLIRSGLELDPEEMQLAYARAFHATWWLVLVLFGSGTWFQYRTTARKGDG